MGEAHAYRVEVGDAPLLVTVEQQSIDLVVEVQGTTAGQELKAAGDGRWGRRVLLVEGAGGRRVDIHPKEKSGWPGRYTIRVETLAEAPAARRQALALMSRAGQQAFAQTPEAWRRAVASYREAVAAWHAVGDRRQEAEALASLAVLEMELDDLRPAREDHEQVLALWRELAEPQREAATLNLLGLARLYTGENEGAREALGNAFSLWQRLGERFEAAKTRSNLCFLEQTVGALPAALDCYKEPRAVFQEIGDQSDEDRILNNLGGIYDLQGEPDAALEHYRQALDLRRALGDHLGEAQTLNNIAVIHRIVGDWQEALRVFGQEREILERFGDRSLQAALLANVGNAYNSLGQPQRALAFLEDALKLRKDIGDRRSEIFILNFLGYTWRKLGDLRKGLDHHEQARKLAAALGDARQEAVTRVRLGETRLEQGEPSAALRELAPALPYLKEAGLRQAELQALQIQGRALTLSGRSREALPVFQEVLARRHALRDRVGEAESLHTLALAERSLGLREEARAHVEAAVARIEELRTGLSSPDLRAAFLATRHRAYSLLIDLLMDRHAADPGGGWDRAAFAVSERARARSLLDALLSAGPGRAGSAVPTELLELRQTLRRRLSAKADQQLKQGGAQAEALGSEIEKLLADLDRVDGEIRRQDPQYAAFSQPQPVGPEEISGLLGPETLLLEYALGEERSFLWVAGAGGLRSFILPPQRKIESLARQAYKELSTVEAGAAHRGKAVAALGRILLDPAWKEVAHAGRLVVVPDGGLHYVPFAALPVPGPSRERLLDHAEVDYLPSATTLALQRQRAGHSAPASKWAAVLADPVFAAGDPRLKGPSASMRTASKNPQRGPAGGPFPVFERLPASRREAEAILSLAPPGQAWAALGLEANRDAVLSGELRAYRVVHFATHAVADTRNPELSGLVLSLVDAAGKPREGFLGLSDIYDLDLAADLVVLSGCRTALGKEVRGEGLMGLTRGFLYAGVPRVVASLWPVEDRASTELMTRFYGAMWQDGLSPAAALRQAQRAMRRDPRYRGPFSWAGFVLQGDWR
jgi:CHAT domain-containing protein